MESFLEGLTPIDPSNKEYSRLVEPRQPNHRDSHDLSLSPRQVTRDSLVTNMLLSLDQFSIGQGQLNTYGGADPTGHDDALRTMTCNSKSGRGNGHGYSYSSDYEGGDNDSRISSQPSRGRRSNSSSGFQSSLGRISSMREASHQSPGKARPPHSRGGKGSKSSSTNSIDPGYAQVLSSQRWASGFGGRSSSFDHEQGRPPPAATSSNAQAPWHIEFSNTFFDDEHDAAPTPTVPAGPRRLATVPSLPVLPVSEPTLPHNGLERKRSTRSSKSATVGRKADIKYNTTRDAPPMPTFALETAAPAPHVGYEKAKEAPPPSAPTTLNMPAKEKQGFFRRMFGSSKNNATSTPQSPASVYVSSTSVETAGSRRSTPPSRESHHSTARPTPTQTLTKKTSSFFRRRKHSVTDAEPPPLPMPPMVLPTAKLPPKEMIAVKPDKPEPSPITSLRRAMDPFFASDPDTPDAATPFGAPSPLSQEQTPPASPPRKEKNEAERHRSTRGFSPEYEPSSQAVIRTVDKDSGDDGSNEQHEVDNPSRQRPEPPTMVRNGSFFNDDNSDDEPSARRRPAKAPPVESMDRGLRPNNPSMDRLSAKGSLASMRQRDGSMARSGATLSPITSRDEGRRESSIALPIQDGDGTFASPRESIYQSAVSLPSVKIDGAEASPRLKTAKSFDEPDFVMGEPTEDDMQKAQRIYDGNEDFIQRDKAAAWMGEEGPVRQKTLRAYMDLYDFKEKSIVTSLRQVCNRLVLRGETQQVDRILVAFAQRWCDCNPNHGFKHMGMLSHPCIARTLLLTFARHDPHHLLLHHAPEH